LQSEKCKFDGESFTVKISSLWKREAGRDFRGDLFKNSMDPPFGIWKLSRRSGRVQQNFQGAKLLLEVKANG
jgi:hypothetical protein